MIGHFSYLDLSADKRAVEARRARDQIRSTMASSFLTAEQRTYLNERLEHIDAWEHGKIVVKPVPAKNALKRLPQHHSIDLNDGVELDEKIK